MKSNKKGFTLTELIATIVILAIVLTIGIASFNLMSNQVKQKTYENLIENIKITGKDYFNDKEVNSVFVETLIQEGYLTADDETNQIYDPVTGKSLNCHLLKKDGDNIIIDENNDYTENGECNFNITAIENLSLKYYYNDEGIDSIKDYDENNWQNRPFTLVPYMNDKVLDNAVYYRWFLPYSPETVYTDKELVIDSDYINTNYKLDVLNNDYTYSVNKVIKIDQIKPIYLNSYINNESESNITIYAKDSESGIDGYYFNNTLCNSDSVFNESNIFNISNGGVLKICIKDKASNITSADINIIKIIYNTNDHDNTTKTLFYNKDDNNSLFAPQKYGYIFEGWFTEDGTQINTFSEINTLNKSDITLNARWKFIDVPVNIIKTEKNFGEMISNKVNIIFILDVSGSMSGTKLSNLKSVVNNLIDTINFDDGSTASVISFASSASIKQNPTTDKNTIKNTINRLSSGGGTNFTNALNKAVSLIQSNDDLKNSPTYSIFVSDGADGGSESSFTNSSNNLKSLVAKSYSIGINQYSNTRLKKIASSEEYYFDTNIDYDSFNEVFQKIKEDIITESSSTTIEAKIDIPTTIYINEEFPLIIQTNNKTVNVTNQVDLNKILTNESNLNLDMDKVDQIYQFNGNFDGLKITYYYRGDS